VARRNPLEQPLTRLAISAAAGFIASAGFAPVSLAGAAAVGFIGLAYLLTLAKSSLESALLGWIWGVAYFSSGLSWTFHSMHVHGGVPAVLAAAGVLLLGAALALFPAGAALLTRLIRAPRVVSCAIVFPALWVIGEWLRGVALGGFGWLSLGYAFTEAVFGSWAPVGGVYAVTAVLAFSGCAMVAFLMVPKEASLTRAGLALWLGALVIGSIALGNLTWSEPGQKLEVRVVQPDLPLVVRARPGDDARRLPRLAAMSERSAMGERGLDLIVWPESVYVQPMERLAMEALQAQRVAKKTGAAVLFNAFSEPKRSTFYNAVWLAEPDGARPRTIYAKRHLVPFGEFVPAGFRWFVDLLGIPMVDQRPGEIPQDPVRVAGVDLALTVCYENMFGEEIRDWWSFSQPGIILNQSNLGWFSDPAAVQFTQMSRMRARETARPVLQAMMTGYSALIRPDGELDRVVDKGAQNLDLTVRAYRGEATPFVRYGNAPLLVLMLVLLGLGLGCRLWSLRRRAVP
jgi:apolipoprotein N-acyltransferase